VVRISNGSAQPDDLLLRFHHDGGRYTVNSVLSSIDWHRPRNEYRRIRIKERRAKYEHDSDEAPALAPSGRKASTLWQPACRTLRAHGRAT